MAASNQLPDWFWAEKPDPDDQYLTAAQALQYEREIKQEMDRAYSFMSGDIPPTKPITRDDFSRLFAMINNSAGVIRTPKVPLI